MRSIFGSPDRVIACAIGQGLTPQLQRVGGVDRGWGIGITMASQDVDDNICRIHLIAERFGASSLHGWKTIGQHRTEDIDHLPIAIV